MKKILTFVFVLIIISINSYADDPLLTLSENDEVNLSTLNVPSDSEYELGLMNLQFDIMGFVLFGPQIALDFQFADIVAVGPFFRWNYAGVVYQGVITDWFSSTTTVSPASYGIGVQGKVLIPVGSGMHRPYAGISYERFNGKDSYDPGGEWGEHIYEYKSNVILLNFGYRLITESSFNLSIGLSLGPSIETENIDYYEEEPDIIDHNISNTRFIGMLQIGLGWQFGK